MSPTARFQHRTWAVDPGDWLILGLLFLFALITAICPIVRAFYHFELDYKEGWMVYNAVAVSRHLPLCSARVRDVLLSATGVSVELSH